MLREKEFAGRCRTTRSGSSDQAGAQPEDGVRIVSGLRSECAAAASRSGSAWNAAAVRPPPRPVCAARVRVSGRELGQVDPAGVVPPRAGDCAVDQERADRVRVLGAEDRRRCSSGRTSVRRACTSSVASQVGRNRTGAGVSPAGSGARGRSTSSFPASSRNDRVVDAVERLVIVVDREPGPARDVGRPGRAEPGEVAPDQQLDAARPRCRSPGRPSRSASPNRSAGRCSQVPDGGTRTRSSHTPMPVRHGRARASASTCLRRHRSVGRAPRAAARRRLARPTPADRA